jgi:hypothetical protein
MPERDDRDSFDQFRDSLERHMLQAQKTAAEHLAKGHADQAAKFEAKAASYRDALAALDEGDDGDDGQTTTGEGR